MKVMNFETDNENLKRQLRHLSPEEVTKIKNKILSDSEIIRFIKKFGDAIDDDMIQRGLSVLCCYIKARDEDPAYMPVLKLYANNFHYDLVERPEHLEKRTKAAWKSKLDVSMMSFENQNADIKAYELTAGNSEAFTACYDIINNYQEGKFQPGIWLVGGFGIGKSYLMTATAKELNDKGAGVKMIDFNNFIKELQSKIKSDSDNMEKMLKQLENVDVLIIDDIGSERLGDYVIDDIIYRVLNTRHKFKKITCFTSNLTKRDYFTSLANTHSKNGLTQDEKSRRAKRVITRIDGLAKEVKMIGGNRREHY